MTGHAGRVRKTGTHKAVQSRAPAGIVPPSSNKLRNNNRRHEIGAMRENA
jgi:hypothetical protein